MKVKENNAKIQKACGESQVQDFSGYPCRDLNEEVPFSLPIDGDDRENVNKGVEPWSFEQHLGQAVFVPAGCPFQVRNLQSTAQLGLDFLSPESLEQAVKLAEEIRCLSNDHATKLQMVEISLYAASSAIKEVQKLVLDPKLGPELVFEDRNLTAVASENPERMKKQRQAVCA